MEKSTAGDDHVGMLHGRGWNHFQTVLSRSLLCTHVCALSGFVLFARVHRWLPLLPLLGLPALSPAAGSLPPLLSSCPCSSSSSSSYSRTIWHIHLRLKNDIWNSSLISMFAAPWPRCPDLSIWLRTFAFFHSFFVTFLIKVSIPSHSWASVWSRDQAISSRARCCHASFIRYFNVKVTYCIFINKAREKGLRCRSVRAYGRWIDINISDWNRYWAYVNDSIACWGDAGRSMHGEPPEKQSKKGDS